MPICRRLKKYLDDHRVEYSILPHAPAYTAQETAASAHVRGREMIKCIMVSGDGRHTLVATTANQRLNLDKLKKALGLREAHLEREEEFRGQFEDCEPGAMPPFGNLYGVPMVVDEAVYEDDDIVFNGGDHASLVKMRFSDFERLAKPKKAAVADSL